MFGPEAVHTKDDAYSNFGLSKLSSIVQSSPVKKVGKSKITPNHGTFVSRRLMCTIVGGELNFLW